MWLSGPQCTGIDADWKSGNAKNSQTSWLDVEDTFTRLKVKQPDVEQPAAPKGSVAPIESCKSTIGSSAFVEEAEVPPSATQTPEGATINDIDAHRLFLGRCNGAEQLYKVFCFLSSPGADDTSWGPLRCSEAQVAVYEHAITQTTRLAVVAQCVPDAFLNPSTRILRHIVAPAREHIAALDDGAPLVWDRARIECTFCLAYLQEALDDSLPSRQAPQPPHANTWRPVLGSSHGVHSTGSLPDARSKFDARGTAAPGVRKKTPIPHVHGITSWRGPPLKLDHAAKQRLKQQFLDALRTPPEPQRDGASDAEPPAGAAAGGGGSGASDTAALPSRSTSLQSAGSSSFGRGMPTSHDQRGRDAGRAVPPQAPQRLRSVALGCMGDTTPRGDLHSQAAGLHGQFDHGQFDHGLVAPSFRPGTMHEHNVVPGSNPWDLPQPRGDSGGGAGALGRQFLAMNHVPPAPPFHSAPLLPLGTRSEVLSQSNDSFGLDPMHSSDGALAQMMFPGGIAEQARMPGGLMHGDTPAADAFQIHGSAAAAVPPQEMARLMFRLAQRLGYPLQRMHEVVSCMQQDYLQAVMGAATW